MSSVKIRLVKCPNCWNVLPESVDVPVYKCGGCGKILQAKYGQQQKEEDGEKSSSDMQGGEDVGDKASSSSKSEEEGNNDDEELKMAHGGNNGVSEIAAEQNSHVEDEEEEETNNNESEELQQTEEGPPYYLKRIMSGSTEYHDPSSTFSETPPTNHQTIRRYDYDASVSSLDNITCLDSRWFLSSSSSSSSQKKPLLLPVKSQSQSQPQPQPQPPYDNSRWRRIRDKKGVFLGDEKRLPPRPSYQSDENSFRSASAKYIDEEKIKLLKIVYELEEQLLKKTCSFGGGGGGVNKHRSHELRPPHWNHDDMISPSSSRIIPFSLPYDNRQLHSEPLPPPPSYKKSIHRTRTGRSSIINSYSSCPSTPVLSPWQEQQNMKNNNKKQHLRPIARAAPFIACHNCSHSLQLPEDFLLFKGRCHRVRCGACSVVMTFSLQNSTYLVPYYQEEEDYDDDDDLDFRAPPPSEADESSSMSMSTKMKMKMKMRRSSSSTSRATGMMGPPLHNLMGYSTVSRVFKGYGPSSCGATSSMQNL